MKKIILYNIFLFVNIIGQAQIRISKWHNLTSTTSDYVIIFSRDSHSPNDTIQDTNDTISETTTDVTMYPLWFESYQKALTFKNKNFSSYKDCVDYNEKIFLKI